MGKQNGGTLTKDQEESEARKEDGNELVRNEVKHLMGITGTFMEPTFYSINLRNGSSGNDYRTKGTVFNTQKKKNLDSLLS